MTVYGMAVCVGILQVPVYHQRMELKPPSLINAVSGSSVGVIPQNVIEFLTKMNEKNLIKYLVKHNYNYIILFRFR